MNQNIVNLYEIAKKPERAIIGLMSGTSLDGLDIALCKISGSGSNTALKLSAFETIPYTDEIKGEIRQVFAKSQVDLQHLCLLNSWLGNLHGEMVIATLGKWNLAPSQIDIIASHGQTIFHAPKALHKLSRFSNSTLQIGDGDHLAVKTGIISISDFRQKHVAVGGEGAPLAMYGDYLLFAKRDETRILLNIGGIANFTYLPEANSSKVLSTDTGPGNTLIDECMRRYFNQNYDKDGEIARRGSISASLLNQLLDHEFFDKSFPKTTGPESFNTEWVAKCQIESDTENMCPSDLVATLTWFTSVTIADAIQKCVPDDDTENGQPKQQHIFIYTSGGGSHNSMILTHLLSILNKNEFTILPMDTLGIPCDAKEAVLFAVLANEAVCGGKTEFSNSEEINSLIPNVSMGKISFPS